MKKFGIQKSSLLLPLGCLLLVVSMSLTVQAGSPQKTDEVTEYVMTEYQYSKLKSNLAELKKNQHSITDGVTAVEGRVESIQQQTADVAESTERAEQRLSDAESQNERAGELIAECESILGSVRKRVQPKAKTN